MTLVRNALSTLSLLGLLGLTTACEGTFYNPVVKTVGAQEIFTANFDDALPDALGELFEECHGSLLIGPETEDVDLIGDCNPFSASSTLSVEATALAIGVITQPPIDMDRVFPNRVKNALEDIYHIQGTFPWPMQNCEIYLDFALVSNGLSLVDFQANWTTRNGQAALHIDFDHQTSVVFAEGDIDGDADCPSAINEPLLQPHVPDGDHEIELSGVDVDVWFLFTVENDEIVASVEADVDIGGVSIDPPLSSMVVSAVGDLETILRTEVGIDLDDLADDIGEDIADRLVDAADEIAGVLEGEIPAEYDPFEVRLGGGGKFKVKGSKLASLSQTEHNQPPTQVLSFP